MPESPPLVDFLPPVFFSRVKGERGFFHFVSTPFIRAGAWGVLACFSGILV